VRQTAAILIHHPVLDRQGETVTTAITNLDLHDLCRTSRCYGLGDLFIAHPVVAQRELASRVRAHWTTGSGARRIPERRPAIEILRIVESLDAALDALGGSNAVELWATSARRSPQPRLDYHQAGDRLASPGPTVLIMLGTGWGLADQISQRAHFQLAPIESVQKHGYNHLSVRAAAAITFDRLLSRRCGQ